MTTPIHVIVLITPAEGKKDAAAATLSALCAKVQEHEPGCLQNEYYWDEKNAQFAFLEKYTGMDAVNFHLGADYFKEIQVQIEAESLLAAPMDVRIITPVGGFSR